MTIQELLDRIELVPVWMLVLVFLTPPVIAWILSLTITDYAAERPPWNICYSALVYSVAAPGTLSAILTAYSIFLLEQNLLTVNVFVYFLPIISMVITLALIGRKVSWTSLPGVDRLYALMIILTITFAATLAIHRTRIFIVFGGSLTTLIYIALICFALIKISMYFAFRKKKTKFPRIK